MADMAHPNKPGDQIHGTEPEPKPEEEVLGAGGEVEGEGEIKPDDQIHG